MKNLTNMDLEQRRISMEIYIDMIMMVIESFLVPMAKSEDLTMKAMS